MSLIGGDCRDQISLLPACVEDYVAPDEGTGCRSEVLRGGPEQDFIDVDVFGLADREPFTTLLAHWHLKQAIL